MNKTEEGLTNNRVAETAKQPNIQGVRGLGRTGKACLMLPPLCPNAHPHPERSKLPPVLGVQGPLTLIHPSTPPPRHQSTRSRQVHGFCRGSLCNSAAGGHGRSRGQRKAWSLEAPTLCCRLVSGCRLPASCSAPCPWPMLGPWPCSCCSRNGQNGPPSKAA
jgi:hypothetical protein